MLTKKRQDFSGKADSPFSTIESEYHEELQRNRS